MLLLLLAACHPDKEPEPTPVVTGDGLFLNGCPIKDKSAARTLVDAEERPWGDDAMAEPGDVLLVNERAAFVIQAPEGPRTYYPYGGTPIDAVAVDGCEQAGPETLGEAGFLVGQLDLTDFESSTLHLFHGATVEIVNDGSDGKAAVVDVHGTDDRFYLIELTLLRRIYEAGGRKELGDLYGLDITVRYTLEPGDAALKMDVLLDGDPVGDGFLVGAVVFPSDLAETTSWSAGDLSLGGISVQTGSPWMSAGTATGSTAIAMPGAAMGYTEIAGVTALLDINQAVSPLEVASGNAETAFVLSVGPTDAASAAAGLESHVDDPVPGHVATWQDVSGTVSDPSGAGVPGVQIDLACPNDAGDDEVLTTLYTDASGAFAGRVLTLGDCTLTPQQEGRDSGAAVAVPTSGGTGLALDIGALGGITVNATDEASAAMPVRIELQRDDGTVVVGFPTPLDPDVAVPPGHWTAYLTRGYEYEPATVDVTVPDDGTTDVVATLARVIDTTSWAGMDSHVHAGPSPDSPVLPDMRMRTAAASGLDVMISTDHEAIMDWSPALTATGLGDQLLYVLGSEVTASLPEHTNAWPFPVADGPRGEPVQWQGLGFPGIYAAERERGATITQLNHARVNGECGILCILDWDRMAEDPSTDDPAALGMTGDGPIWSWDFDSFELLNSERSPFLDPADPRRSGALNDWFAFYNLGHHPTGTGVTDEHDLGTPGTPRTYVRVPDDTIGVLTEQDMSDGVLAGRAQVSSGAFATVTVDGKGPGERVTAIDGLVSLSVKIEALEAIDVNRVEVIVNCDAGLTLDAIAPDSLVKLDTTVPVSLPLGVDSYIVVLAMGENAMPRGITNYDAASVPRVIVNPVLVDGNGDGVWDGPGAKTCTWAL